MDVVPPQHVCFQVLMESSRAATTKGSGKARPVKALPTRRVAFPKQLEILRGYAIGGTGGVPVQNRRLAQIVGMSFKTTSLANAFFLDIGFITRTEGGNVPSAEVVAFQQTYQWNPDEAAHELAPILEESWFGKALLPQLQFQPTSEEEALVILGRDAQAGPEYRAELRLLLDYLEAGGVVTRDASGTLRPAQRARAGRAPQSEPEAKAAPEPAPPRQQERGGPLPLLIQGLLEQLPKDGRWTHAQADRWLEMARLAFEVAYEFEDDFDPREGRDSPDE